MKLTAVEATEYLKENQLRPKEEFIVDACTEEFDELYSSVKELRGLASWIEPFSPDDVLNAFLREVVRGDLEMRFVETFPSSQETQREIYVISRPVNRKSRSPSLSLSSLKRLIE